MVDNPCSVSVSSAFSDKISDVLLRHREVKVVGKDLLNVSGVDLLLISLIEKSEALTGLLSVSVLLDVSVANAVEQEVKFIATSLQKVWIVLLDFIVHVLR